jgi:hypothetical protein
LNFRDKSAKVVNKIITMLIELSCLFNSMFNVYKN